ncbi:ankyrin repeat-containing domain protein [Aspergillus foveolatus]|uniref:ankyrin repeat-containing domain protein n=1 Tax=Aspergillus foveolatus TaxID=210207 RepID=UPI003CCCB4FF
MSMLLALWPAYDDSVERLENYRSLYEIESGFLLRKIIRRNDTKLLKQYITAWDHPSCGITVTDIQSHDPFYMAAAHGSLDMLRVLLDVHLGNAHSVSTEEEQGFSLLHVACQQAQIGIEWTPLISAAYSTRTFGEGADADAADRAWGKALINMLLDRGASARDNVPFPTTDIDMTSEGQLVPQQAEFTVLSLAITGSSYGMVKRLLEHGADIQQRLGYYSNGPGFWDDGFDIRDVTALHLGSRAWNVDGIRAVLGYCHEKRSHLISCRDSMGGLPLHYAAAGFDPTFGPTLLENTLVQKITSTFELLVPNDAEATAKLINAHDKQGATRLRYAVRTHASCGSQGSNHAYHAIQWLYSRGANAGIVDHKMQTLLLDHGCAPDTTDDDSETPLHILPRHRRQAHAAKMLIESGARVDIVNKGNLPLHEATRGMMRPRESWDRQRLKPVVQALLNAHGTPSVLDQPNSEEKTPRQLREETRREWIEMEAPSTKPGEI